MLDVGTVRTLDRCTSALPKPTPVPAKGVPVTELPESVRYLDAVSLLRRKRIAYVMALEHLDAWLADRPLDDRELAAYLSIMHEQRLSPASATHLVEAVELRCRLADILPPLGPATERLLEAVRRDGRPGVTTHPTGLRWHQADAAAAAAGSDVTDVRDAAIIATASDALLRTTEISALDVADLEVAPDGTGRLSVRNHDRAGEGTIAFLGEPTVRRLRTWLDKGEIEGGPLFRRMHVRRAGDRRLSARGVLLVIARRARAGEFFSYVTADSLRMGAALSLAAAGAPLDEILEAGRWTTLCAGSSSRRMCAISSIKSCGTTPRPPSRASSNVRLWIHHVPEAEPRLAFDRHALEDHIAAQIDSGLPQGETRYPPNSDIDVEGVERAARRIIDDELTKLEESDSHSLVDEQLVAEMRSYRDERLRFLRGSERRPSLAQEAERAIRRRIEGANDDGQPLWLQWTPIPSKPAPVRDEKSARAAARETERIADGICAKAYGRDRRRKSRPGPPPLTHWRNYPPPERRRRRQHQIDRTRRTWIGSAVGWLGRIVAAVVLHEIEQWRQDRHRVRMQDDQRDRGRGRGPR